MLEQIIQAYAQGRVDLRGGAALAGISYNRFLQEVQARRLVVLQDATFLERLYELGETFENQDLLQALRAVQGE